MELTVITINLNNRDGLRRTMDSVRAQTWKGFEWILIDGGSTDGSRELILEHQDDFAFWCSEPDDGIYPAMNKGCARASGDYVLFLNSGDSLYDPTVLERVHAAGLQDDIVAGQMVRLDNGLLFRHYDPDILVQLYTDTIGHQATFIRRNLLEKYPYDESLRIVSDWKFWLEAIVLGQCSFTYLDIIVSKQDMTGISLAAANAPLLRAERKQVLQELLPQPVLNTLGRYVSYRNQPVSRNMSYLEESHPSLYKLLKKTISLVTRICRAGDGKNAHP